MIPPPSWRTRREGSGVRMAAVSASGVAQRRSLPDDAGAPMRACTSTASERTPGTRVRRSTSATRECVRYAASTARRSAGSFGGCATSADAPTSRSSASRGGARRSGTPITSSRWSREGEHAAWRTSERSVGVAIGLRLGSSGPASPRNDGSGGRKRQAGGSKLVRGGCRPSRPLRVRYGPS